LRIELLSLKPQKLLPTNEFSGDLLEEFFRLEGGGGGERERERRNGLFLPIWEDTKLEGPVGKTWTLSISFVRICIYRCYYASLGFPRIYYTVP
jgi:hypothetical protein